MTDMLMSPYRDLIEFGFFVSIGITAGSLGLI